MRTQTRRKIKLVASGRYIPKRVVPASEIDALLGLSEGSSERMSGVAKRHYADPVLESSSVMGAKAAKLALENAKLSFKDIDAVVCASGAPQQTIPCTAALIQEQLGELESGKPAFDINSTCLSFVVGLDSLSYMLDAGRYERILLISTEIASVGINYEHAESACLFGDGAVAWVVERTPTAEYSEVLYSKLETYASGADTCRIEGGGTKYHPRNNSKYSEEENKLRPLFHMDGRKVFKQASQVAPEFFARVQKESGLDLLKDIALFIPHQASKSGMEIVRRKLEIPDEKFMNILSDHGNMISASIPLALSYAVEQGRVKRGDKVMLLGTSAGFSIGCVIFEL